MPQVIAFIPAIAAAAGATAWALGAITIASAVVGGVLARNEAKRAASRARDAYNASLRDRSVMVRNQLEGRDIVLGRVRKSGQVAFVASYGANKERLALVVAVAGHQIDAFEQWYVNDELVTLDGGGNVTTGIWQRQARRTVRTVHTVTTAGTLVVVAANAPIAGTVRGYVGLGGGGGAVPVPLSAPVVAGSTITFTSADLTVGRSVNLSYEWNQGTPLIKLRGYLGTAGQAADADLVAALPGVWTANHRLRGVAYFIAELLFDQDVFTNGIPNFSAVVRGARVFDPRTATTAWSENVALLMRHYYTHPLGGRQSAASVNDTAVIAAANVCDQAVVYNVVRGGVPVAEPRNLYTAGFVVKSGTRPKEALDELAVAMAGKWCVEGDRFTMRAGAYTSPVLTLADDDFSNAGGVTIEPTRPREELFNIVSGSFIDRDQAYRLTDFPRVRAVAYIGADGTELTQEVELGAVTYIGQAQHVVAVMLRDARQALTLQASFKLRAYPVQVLDVVAITNARFGWVAKPFEVLQRRWTLDGLIELTLKETAPAIYTMDALFTAADLAPNTLLPRPGVVSPVTGLVLSSAASVSGDGTPQTRLEVQWTLHPDVAVLQGGAIEIQYARVDEAGVGDEWDSVTVPGSATKATITGLWARWPYLVRLRARTALSRSNWTPLQPVVVNGYSGAIGALTLVGSTGVTIVGNSATKSSGVDSWNAHAYSVESLRGGAYVECIAPGPNLDTMIGLNTDPQTNITFGLIDFAWHMDALGFMRVFASGVLQGAQVAYNPGDIAALLYDGARVFWVHNGRVIYSAAAAAGLVLFVDTSLFQVGATLAGIAFEPVRAPSQIGTDQVQPGTATDVIFVTAAAPVVSANYSRSFGGHIRYLASASWLNDTDESVFVEVSVDSGGLQTSEPSSGNTYLLAGGATLVAPVDGGTNNSDLIDSAFSVQTEAKRRVAIRGITVPPGSTVYGVAALLLTPVSGGGGVTAVGRDVFIRMAVIKR